MIDSSLAAILGGLCLVYGVGACTESSFSGSSGQHGANLGGAADLNDGGGTGAGGNDAGAGQDGGRGTRDVGKDAGGGKGSGATDAGDGGSGGGKDALGNSDSGANDGSDGSGGDDGETSMKTATPMVINHRSEEHTSELQSH